MVCLLIAIILFGLKNELIADMCLLTAVLMFGLKKDFIQGGVSSYCNIVVWSKYPTLIKTDI